MIQYERAIGALELLAEPDPLLDFELRVGLAIALRAASDERYRDAAFAAAAIARSIGDPDLLVRAAMTFESPFTTRMGNVDDEVTGLLEE
ncbi:MAG: hypothetical protein GWN79_27205, partial [Actinobacteria bacterium]|nr:hypothetical protein [Actinomycetota bacterium]NIU22499.1 hypothetical protein [Actinomycetota bacterium]NIU71197.1 hypothetical protein [Actinomycetota bacterium]